MRLTTMKVSLNSSNGPTYGRVDRASVTEMVDPGSIPGRVKPKIIRIDIYRFHA